MTLKIESINGHYELFVDDVFFCSGDSPAECISEYDKAQKQNNQKGEL